MWVARIFRFDGVEFDLVEISRPLLSAYVLDVLEDVVGVVL